MRDRASELPVTGADFRRVRAVLLGASIRSVATHASVPHPTLARWEQNLNPIEEPRLSNWRSALLGAANDRRKKMAHEGITDADIAGSDFERAHHALARYVKEVAA